MLGYFAPVGILVGATSPGLWVGSPHLFILLMWVEGDTQPFVPCFALTEIIIVVKVYSLEWKSFSNFIKTCCLHAFLS